MKILKVFFKNLFHLNPPALTSTPLRPFETNIYSNFNCMMKMKKKKNIKSEVEKFFSLLPEI